MSKYYPLDRQALWICFSLLILSGCSGGLEDRRTPTGSHSIAFDEHYEVLAVANTDAGTISFVNESSHKVDEVSVGLEPTRIVRAGQRFFVSLRAERSIAVLSKRDGAYRVEKKIKVGTEPYGLVATERGGRVFVAASTAGQVLEISPRNLSVIRKWDLGSEIRWLGLRPQNDTIYALHAFGGKVSHLNLNNNRIKEIQLPTDLFRSTRLTGDPAFSADGHYLILPGLLVDHHSPVTGSMGGAEGGDLTLDELTDLSPDTEEEPFESSGDYASGRFQGGLFELELDPDTGEPTDDPDGTVFIPIDGSSDGGIVNGYPTSVSVSPSGGFYMVTVEATHAVLAISAERPDNDSSFFEVVTGNDSSQNGVLGVPFSFRSSEVISRVEGARGTVFYGDRLIAIDGFLGRGIRFQDISSLHLPKVGDSNGFFFPEAPNVSGTEPGLQNLIATTSHRLPDAVERGRKLFFSGVSPQMSSSFSGVSCATCHAEGRNDGLSWNFSSGLKVRQTLTLAGKVSAFGPVTWTGNVPTVAHEAVLTSQGRMGGRGLTSQDAQDIAAYIDWSREADYPLKNAPIVGRLAEGQALFFSPDVGCATCHSGTHFGSAATFKIVGEQETKAVSLRGVAVTAPYMHDGSSPTLGDVLKRCRTGFMGDTSQLSQSDLDSLELYLQSL